MKIIKSAMARRKALLLIASLPTLCFAGMSGNSAYASSIEKLDGEYGVVQTRIIGGERAAENAWPSAVALVRNSTQSLFLRQFCGANLINARWAVTAAHCLYDGFGQALQASGIKAAMNFNDLADDTDAIEVMITNLYIHPLYNNSDPSSAHDLALIELAQSVDQPYMQLFDGDARQNAGQAATVIGWGVSDYSNPSQPLFPSELNQVSVPIVSQASCNATESYNGLIGDGQICAGFREGGRDSCLGDSGGPLMMQQNGEYRQLGVVSFGRGCAEANFYGVYTRLDFYKTWIGNITGITDFSNPDTLQGNGAVEDSRQTFVAEAALAEKADEGGGASLGALLPLTMLLMAVFVFRRGRRENSQMLQAQSTALAKGVDKGLRSSAASPD